MSRLKPPRPSFLSRFADEPEGVHVSVYDPGRVSANPQFPNQTDIAQALLFFDQQRETLKRICADCGIERCVVLPETSGAHPGNRLVLELLADFAQPPGQPEAQFEAALQARLGEAMERKGITHRSAPYETHRALTMAHFGQAPSYEPQRNQAL